MTTACFTGRRPKDLAGFRPAPYVKFSDDLKDYIRKLYTEEGTRVFISGGAQGFDQLAFWAVDAVKQEFEDIQNIVYVPFRGQQLRWSNDPFDRFNKDAYERMLFRADYFQIVTSLKGNEMTKQEAGSAMQARNRAMVDSSEFVIALYAGDDWSTTGKGGTCNTMRYAKQKKKPIYQIKYSVTTTLNFKEVVKIFP